MTNLMDEARLFELSVRLQSVSAWMNGEEEKCAKDMAWVEGLFVYDGVASPNLDQVLAFRSLFYSRLSHSENVDELRRIGIGSYEKIVDFLDRFRGFLLSKGELTPDEKQFLSGMLYGVSQNVFNRLQGGSELL